MPTAIGWRTTRRLFQMEITANIEVVFGMTKEKRRFLFLQYLYWAFNIPTYRRYLFLPYICRHNHNLYVRLSEKYISICKYISCNKYQYNAADTRNCMFRYMGLDIQKNTDYRIIIIGILVALLLIPFYYLPVQ